MIGIILTATFIWMIVHGTKQFFAPVIESDIPNLMGLLLAILGAVGIFFIMEAWKNRKFHAETTRKAKILIASKDAQAKWLSNHIYWKAMDHLQNRGFSPKATNLDDLLDEHPEIEFAFGKELKQLDNLYSDAIQDDESEKQNALNNILFGFLGRL